MQQVRARDEEERIVSSRHSEVNLQIREWFMVNLGREAKTVHRGLRWQTKKRKLTLGNLRSLEYPREESIWLDCAYHKVSTGSGRRGINLGEELETRNSGTR